MSSTIKVRHKYFCLFENVDEDEIIYVHYEDLDGYIHYEYWDDLTRQIYKMTKTQLLNEYKRFS
ncbi:hypothetical protein WD019_15320 [Fictibacillus sp. Mic-4]|uniref:hypothetical protein n=1 Tax=Fictibacillus sp. Mic-4 TaxID=3132826 RepID=UPI003CED1F69